MLWTNEVKCLNNNTELKGKFKQGKSIKKNKIKRYQSTEQVKYRCNFSDLIQTFFEDNGGLKFSGKLNLPLT